MASRLASAGLLVGLLLAATAAQAATELCLEVKSDAEEDREGLRRLAVDELGHHPSHRVVEQGCGSTLVLELFRVAGQQYLTVRIQGEIPVRYKIRDSGDLPDKLSEALPLVLGNDPVHLAQDITHMSLVQRAAHSILKRGNNYYRIELFQLVGNSNNAVAYAPGGAFSFTRGADNWQVFARLSLGGWPGTPTDNDAALRLHTGLDVGLTYEFNDVSSTSPYLSAGFGLQFMRFEGFSGPANDRQPDVANQVLAALTVRAGFRFLRIFDFDCDLYLAGHLPLHPVHDEDSVLFRERRYTPFLQVGIGVGF